MNLVVSLFLLSFPRPQIALTVGLVVLHLDEPSDSSGVCKSPLELGTSKIASTNSELDKISLMQTAISAERVVIDIDRNCCANF